MNCFICGEPLEGKPTVNVGEKGLNSLRDASKKRKDRKYNLIAGLTTTVVHRKCQKNYVNEKLIAAFLKKGPVPSYPVVPRQTRTDIPPIDFKTSCFLCGEVIDEDLKVRNRRLPAEKREHVFRVTQLEFRNTILQLADLRNDDWGSVIRYRLEPVEDLVAEEGRYHASCLRKLHRKPPAAVSGTIRKGRDASKVDVAMQPIYTYLDKNSSECQFSLQDLIKKITGTFRPDVRTVKAALFRKYGDQILISNLPNLPAVLSFRSTEDKILSENFYNAEKCADERTERLRIVKAAAGIILEDIRSKIYDTKNYPPSDDFLKNVESDIPETLQIFLQEVILKHKRQENKEKWRKKCTALAHCIISAARPRSFLSPLQISVAAFIYKKFGSRRLIETLESLGFCASYNEATTFEISAIMRSPLQIDVNSFSQFVFDNADFNSKTLDGMNTLHAMGGIQCVTPRSAIAPNQFISRIGKKPSAAHIGKFGHVPLYQFEKKSNVGFSSVTLRNLNEIKAVSNVILPSSVDLLWLYAQASGIPVPGWSGILEEATQLLSFERTFVVSLPFINAPPSNYDTVYTSMITAAEKCRDLKQKSCFITFDQPLYWKAVEIQLNSANPLLKNVIVRLGGFHLLMSFLGAVGYLMNGSGLREVFQTVYAVNSVDKMMTGHAYARALRANNLCYTALSKLIITPIDLIEDVKCEISNFLWDCDRSVILLAEKTGAYKEFSKKFEERLLELDKHGATAQLWVQYFRMVSLVKSFILAERMGNWELHLDTIQKMMPFFFASGHFLYAKSCQMYLQQMRFLKDKMSREDFENFTTKGKFTIRRTNKYFSGTWSDMAIEQTLMKSMKSVGGLTRGRGVSDAVLTTWTLGAVYLQNVCDSVEQFVNVNYETTEQHVELRSSRVERDKADVERMFKWFEQHPPFPIIDELKSISTGIVGDASINCHLAQKIGTERLRKLEGKDFQSVKYERKQRCLPLGVMKSGVKIDDESVPVDPSMLFRRICIAKKSDAELEKFFEYELAPFPPSLFDEGGMRKSKKSMLYECFKAVSDPIILDNAVHIIDGGFLLHRVIWPRIATFSSICDAYVNYIRSKYPTDCIIVFDGYPDGIENCSTKSAERVRRERKHSSVDIIFDGSMTPSVAQAKFLSNGKNKHRLIQMLKSKFEYQNFEVRQATEDADCLIITTGIEVAEKYNSVYIVGEDVDLLVLYTALSKNPHIYFLKPGKGKESQALYSSHSLEDEIVSKNILFIHAFSGCDTTSSIFNRGKKKIVTTLTDNPDLLPLAELFLQPNANQSEIANAGNQILLRAYGCVDKKCTLNNFRHQTFVKTAFNVKQNIANLPPSEAAAKQHSLRTYHQVQLWLGNELNPEKWGWKKSNSGLTAVTTELPPAPPELLRQLACKCKTGCRAACGCRKSGLKCSILCTNCNSACLNSAEELITDVSDDEDDPQEVALELLCEEIEAGVDGDALESDESEDENYAASENFSDKNSGQEPSAVSSSDEEPGPSAAVIRRRRGRKQP